MGKPTDIEHESDRHEMYAALGKAISRWGRIEGSLSLIFYIAIGSRRSESADAAFNAIRSAEAKINATHAAFKITFRNKPDLVAEWEVQYKRIEKLRPKRNRLAHGQVVSIKVGGAAPKVRFLPFYHPNHHMSYKTFEQWTINDLEDLSKKFAVLAADLFNFGVANLGVKAVLEE